MNKVKKLRQMTKPELLKLFEEFSLLLPDVDKPTNPELIDALETKYQITDKYLKAYREKKDTKLDETDQGDYEPFAQSDDGTVVICMDRKNASYAVGRYTFTQAKRFLPVDKDTAEILLKEHTGFHKATREEIKRNFKL